MATIARKTFNLIELLKVNSDPNGTFAISGSLALDMTTGNKWINISESTWILKKAGNPILQPAVVPQGSQYQPEQYGAVGNGTTDDTTAIQNAYDAAYAIGGVLQFGAKIYKITQPIQTKNGRTTIRGVAGSRISGAQYNIAGLRTTLLEDFKGTRIYAAGCTAFDRDDTADSHGFMTIENLAIVGDGQNVAAIDFGTATTNATAYNNFINVSVFNFGIGFDISNQYGSSWVNCRANSCNIGFQNGYQNSGMGANRAKIDNVSVDACNICFLMIDGSGVEISNVLAQQDCGPLLYLKPRSNGAVNNISISSVHYETSTDSRAICIFDGGFGSNSSAGAVSASDILVTKIYTNSPSLKDGLKLVNTNSYNGLYRMTWAHIMGLKYNVTLPDWAFACRFESCRLNSLNVSAPQDVAVLMCEFGGNYGNNVIKQSGVNIL